MPAISKLLDAAKVAEAGERIYRRHYQQEYEASHSGKFVAINVSSERAFLSTTLREAIEEGRAADPEGLFHVIRIGFPSVYDGGFQMSHVDSQRIPG
jgi:hypothetical protein